MYPESGCPLNKDRFLSESCNIPLKIITGVAL